MKTLEELQNLKYNELLAYAKELGITGLKKKEDLIKEILKKQDEKPAEQPKEETPEKPKTTTPPVEWKEGDEREFKDGTYIFTKIVEKEVEKLSWRKKKITV